MKNTGTFKLISASTRSFVDQSKLKSRRMPDVPPEISLKIPTDPTLKKSQGSLTILVGSNGTGKSRLLSKIAEAFLMIERGQRSGKFRFKRFPLGKLCYQFADSQYEITVDGSSKGNVLINGRSADIMDVVLPSRVIALTNTVHDRFPFNSIDNLYEPDRGEKVYKYLGLRDRSRRASLMSFLYSAIEQLVQIGTDEGERRDRISTVFNLLKYYPKLDISYNLRMPKSVVREAQVSSKFLDEISDYQRGKLLRYFNLFPDNYDKFRNSLTKAVHLLSDSKFITVSINLAKDGLENSLIRELQMLRKTGFLSIVAVELEKHSGAYVNLREASSGELNIAASMIALAGAIDDSSLVLIDEPETSLHPEWQSIYLETMLKTFSSFKNCHYIVATHSPLVVSDAPDGALAISLDNHLVTSGDQFSGASSDKLLAELFKLPTVSNLYLRDQITIALRMSAEGKIESEEFYNIVDDLNKICSDIEDDHPVRSVIDALNELVELKSND